MKRKLLIIGILLVTFGAGGATSFALFYEGLEIGKERHIWLAWHEGCVLSAPDQVHRDGCDAAMLQGCGEKCLTGEFVDCGGQPLSRLQRWTKKANKIIRWNILWPLCRDHDLCLTTFKVKEKEE